METHDQKIPDKVFRLLQKLMERQKAGVGEITSQAEMEEIQAQIARLTLEYNLEMEDIESHSGAAKNVIDQDRVDMNGLMTRHEAGWVHSLFTVIAKYNMCRAIGSDPIQKKGKDDMGNIILIGKRHNVEIVKYLVDQLIVKIRSMWSDAWKIYEGEEKRNTHRRGFFKGAVKGIGHKLKMDSLKQYKQHQQGDKNPLAVMVANNSQAIEKYVYENLGGTSSVKSKGLKGMTGYHQGYEAGRNADINTGIGNSGGGTKYLN